MITTGLESGVVDTERSYWRVVVATRRCGDVSRRLVRLQRQLLLDFESSEVTTER